MIGSDLKAALRSIFRNKVPSAISVLGLGIGLGCIIVLLSLIVHERSFDTYIPDHKNVYRIIFGNFSQTQFPLAETMSREFPEVKDFFRYYQANPLQVKTHKNEILREQGFGFADSSVFRVLGIRFISGTPARAITEVAISERSALKYFGTASPVGSVIQVKLSDGFTPLIVSGVYNDFPSNSTLDPSFIADIRLSEKMFRQFQRSLGEYGNENTSSLDWKYVEFLSYVVLDNNADPSKLAVKMDKYKDLIVNENKDKMQFKLQPVADIYLGSADISGNFYVRGGNPEELKYYEAISILILIISITNYILLARAGAAERVRELGTRKVFGASGGKLTRLLILESFIVVLVSLVPASFVIDYGIGFINETLNKTLSGSIFLKPELWVLLSVLVVLTGLITGMIIGLSYSTVPAIRLMTGTNRESRRSSRWNYSFLLLHFTIYIFLVSGLIGVFKQIKFSMTRYKGINPENVLIADLNTNELKKSFNAICSEMEKIPGVVATAGGSYIPPFGNYLPINLATTDGTKVRFDGLIMGEGMPELLQIEMLEGDSFGPFRQGVLDVIINESAAKEHKLKAGDNFLGFNIRGIAKDFHAHSLHTLIQSMVILQQNPERMGLIAIRTSGNNDVEIKARLKELYTSISPDEIFEVSYLTEQIDNFYARERNQAKIIMAFSILAAILSIMGLFGISLINISRRRKEIGIRKVNGSSISLLLAMLNIDFLRWVLAAVIISVPLTSFILNKWLERFAYRTEMSWWIFALASVSAILIAILTVSWQSWAAATRNPVEALRYE